MKNKGKKNIVKCDSCGDKIIIWTNIYDISNSGRGTCKCGAVVHIN